MTAAEIRAAIKAVVLDDGAMTFLERVGRFARADMRAHAVLVAPQVIATWHPCGHTSWVNYDLPGRRGGLSEAGCALMARRWTWSQGGVSAPCPTCLPHRNKNARPRVQKGPAWSQRLRDAEQSLKESLMPGECYFCGVDNAGSPVPCTSEKHQAMAPQARASFRDAMSGVGLGHAADWAAAEYERRTRLIASGVRVNLYWIDPTQRVAWSEVRGRFDLGSDPQLRIDFQPLFDKAIKKRKLWAVLKSKIKAAEWAAKHPERAS